MPFGLMPSAFTITMPFISGKPGNPRERERGGAEQGLQDRGGLGQRLMTRATGKSGLGRDALKKDSRGLSRGAAGNPRVPRLLPGTLGNFPGCL